MLLSSLLLITAGFGVYAHPTEQHHDHDHDHEDADTIRRALDVSLNAMGGLNALKKIESFTYTANTIYRSKTLGQNYNLFTTDQSVASGGSQNMTFSSSANGLKSRLDRSYKYDFYWSWGRPQLEPGMGFSVVTQDGADGFACFNHGQNSFFAPDPTMPLGYTDPFLSDYLIHQAHQFAFPWLIKELASNIDKLKLGYETDRVTGTKYIALGYPELELSVLIDSKTHLPAIVRSHEDHAVFGRSTSDLVMTAWSNVALDNQKDSTNTILHPHRFQTIYNSESTLEDFIIDTVTINPTLPADFFDAHPPPPNPEQGQFQIRNNSRPARNPEYPRSEVHEFFESGLWSGPFGEIFNTSDVRTTHPVPGRPEIQTIFVGYPDYVQLLIEFEDGLLITDAPAHRSKIILEWIAQNMNGKKVKYVVPSHHHRDHAGGVADYVAAGATLVIPDLAKDFYTLSPNTTKAKISTYTTNTPFHKRDKNVQFTSYLGTQNPHAEDWTFAIAGAAKPTKGEDLVLYNADVINPGTDAVEWDSAAARDVLTRAMHVGLPRGATIVGTHGSTQDGNSTTDTLVNIADIIGFPYPELTAKDWKAEHGRE